MRAPNNEARGTSGQSFVKGEFEELGWGAVLNPEHDLGTDVWLMARDVNRFDLQALVGAQVKTGASYFEDAEKDESGEVIGWWFYEADDSHFDYWSEHTTPHILVLRDQVSKTSYWVHVTSDDIMSTGKGNKILVPVSHLVNESNRDALTSVATSASKSGSLDGSAWGSSWKVPTSDRLRYPLMAPRLVAPHPNKGVVHPDPVEAIALLVQGRFRDLETVISADQRNGAEDVVDASAWEWKLFDAVWSWVESGNLSKFEALPEPAEDHCLAAAAVAHSAALIEQGRPEDALAAVRGVRAREGLETVDRAWIGSHEARCLVELGRLEEARDIALDVQSLRAVAPADPTARALVATTTMLVFNTSGFGMRDVAELIESVDTSTRWWRSQTIASGLEAYFDKQFKSWARDSSVTWGAMDTVWADLRSAALLAGLAADHGGWRHSMSLLARRGLMKATGADASIILESLTDLVRAGASKELELAVSKLSDEGPVEPLAALISGLDLESVQRSGLKSMLTVLQYGGDLAEPDDADRHVEWLVSALKDPDSIAERLRPQFYLEVALLDALGGLMQSISSAKMRNVVDHILSLPVIEDQMLANELRTAYFSHRRRLFL